MVYTNLWIGYNRIEEEKGGWIHMIVIMARTLSIKQYVFTKTPKMRCGME